ncbi:MAG: hypothetical protein PWR26_1005 [Methanosarcinales archaeon]|nr:hypothetical protein [Methanosarcinales archaeon]
MVFLFKGVKEAVKNKLREAILEEDRYKQAGDEFENYVLGLFDERYFKVIDWTRDTSKQAGRYVKSDSNPDFTIEYTGAGQHTGSKFAVECKFRSSLSTDENERASMVDIARYEQLFRYAKYSIKNKVPVFIVVGLGGRPNRPREMFCIPLEEIEYEKIFYTTLKRWKRDPTREFYWNGERLEERKRS